MQLIRKILKENLVDFEATNDIIVSITEDNSIFINTKEGKQKRITDIVIGNSEEIAQMEKHVEKLYIIKDIGDIQVYDSIANEMVSFKTLFNSSVDNLASQLELTNERINEIVEDNNIYKEEIASQMTTITNSFNDLQNNISMECQNLTKDVQENKTNIETIQSSINTINEKIVILEESITTINTNITNLTENIISNTTDINNLKDSFNNHVNDFNELVNTVTENGTKLNNIDSELTTIQESLNTVKNYNGVYDLNDLEVGLINPEIYIPAYIFRENDFIKISTIILRATEAPTENLSIKIVYAPELESGKIGTETVISTLTLAPEQYKTSIEIPEESRVEYTNGYIRVYITEVGNNQPDATILIKFYSDKK